MAEDKIRKIAERLTEQMPSHFRKAETARAERILREQLEGLMEAAGIVVKLYEPQHTTCCPDGECQIKRLEAKLAEYGWPWRKS